MSDLDYYQQYRWALEKLQEAFGAGNVAPAPPQDQGQVLAVEVRNPAGGGPRPLYRVVFKDHLLHDLNKHAAPGTFLDGEIERARAYFDGRSQDSVTLP